MFLEHKPLIGFTFWRRGCHSHKDPSFTVKRAGPICHNCTVHPCNQDPDVNCTGFRDGEELRKAIRVYSDDNSKQTVVAGTYGWPIDTWDVSMVTDFSRAFKDYWRFNPNISRWNTSSAIYMDRMFMDNHWFSHDISSWDVRRVRSFRYQFKNALSFNANLSPWSLSSAESTGGMFNGASYFKQDLCAWSKSFPSNRTANTDVMFVGSKCPDTLSLYCYDCSLPSSSPSNSQLAGPSNDPTLFPSTNFASRNPSHQPSATPTTLPSPSPTFPSLRPTLEESELPSTEPSVSTVPPTLMMIPSVALSTSPSDSPSHVYSFSPFSSSMPSGKPSATHSDDPTQSVSSVSSSKALSNGPSTSPSCIPSVSTASPSQISSANPTYSTKTEPSDTSIEGPVGTVASLRTHSPTKAPMIVSIPTKKCNHRSIFRRFLCLLLGK